MMITQDIKSKSISCFDLSKGEISTFPKWTLRQLNYSNIPKIDDLKHSDKSMHLAASSSCFSNNLKVLKQKMDKTYSKRAYEYLFLKEGLEQWQISDGIDLLDLLMREYEEFAVSTYEFRED